MYTEAHEPPNRLLGVATLSANLNNSMVIVTQNTYWPNESMVKTNEFLVKNYFSNQTGFYGNPPKVSDPSLKFIESLQNLFLVKQLFKTNKI